MKTAFTIALMLSNFLLRAQPALPPGAIEKFKKFEDKYNLSNYINPSVLEADLSGDSIVDVALLIERKSDRKKGILILFGKSNRSFVVGAGNEFGNAGDHFDWADIWKIFTDETTYETTFEENGDVKGGRRQNSTGRRSISAKRKAPADLFTLMAKNSSGSTRVTDGQ